MSSSTPSVRTLDDTRLLTLLGVDPAHAAQALRRAGTLRNLLALPSADAPALAGLSPADHRRLLAAAELGRRNLLASLAPGAVLATRDQAKHYALALARDLRVETFHTIWLDPHHRVLATDQIASGTIDTARVYPREIVRRGIEVGATGTLLLHNHVSGLATASPDDRRLTRRLVDLLAAVRIQIFDHLIVGDGYVTSFQELGILPAPDPATIG